MPGLSTTTRVPLGGRPFGGRPFGEVAVQADAAVVGPAFGELVAVRESEGGIVRVCAEVGEEVGHGRPSTTATGKPPSPEHPPCDGVRWRTASDVTG